MTLGPEQRARYLRQTSFAELGIEGQRRLLDGSALVVGAGGLGSWLAELLVRAGVGRLRLVDDDRVDLTNLHRQAMYDLADATAARPKVIAAAGRLATINPGVAIEPVDQRLNRQNIASLASGMQIILDATDDWPSRYLINDWAVQTATPWVFAGVVGAQGQTMTVLPGRSACLRCVIDHPPPVCSDPRCRDVGVIGPAVATLASLQAAEALKILSGRADCVSPYLRKLDLWANHWQQIDVRRPAADCPCCRRRRFDYLEE